MYGKKKVAAVMTATTLATVGGGIGAAGAQSQSEVLQGAAATISGQASGGCSGYNPPSVGVGFNAAGSATGPYPGQFTNTNATANVSGVGLVKPFVLPFRANIPFTIDSGTTTINGRITYPHPAFGWYICNGVPVGLTAYGAGKYTTLLGTYTAMIRRPGQLAQTISGTADVRGSFYITRGAQTTVTETLAFP